MPTVRTTQRKPGVTPTHASPTQTQIYDVLVDVEAEKAFERRLAIVLMVLIVANSLGGNRENRQVPRRAILRLLRFRSFLGHSSPRDLLRNCEDVKTRLGSR